jgi:hypothetical protein
MRWIVGLDHTEQLEQPALGYDEQDSETAKSLGKLTTGKGCVYIERMDDINTDVLAGMVKKAFLARHNVEA